MHSLAYAEIISRIRGREMSKVYTIGHSNQSSDEFIALLVKQSIDQLMDVRSKPRSRFPHFNQKALKQRLADQDIAYRYLGDLLGGYPEAEELYWNDRVVYERVVALPEFRRGIGRVLEESEKHCLVLMCAQENPRQCHRHPLLASELIKRGARVLHLRRDGSVQDAASMTEPLNPQLPLIEPVGEDLTWKSPNRIRRRS